MRGRITKIIDRNYLGGSFAEGGVYNIETFKGGYLARKETGETMTHFEDGPTFEYKEIKEKQMSDPSVENFAHDQLKKVMALNYEVGYTIATLKGILPLLDTKGKKDVQECIDRLNKVSG